MQFSGLGDAPFSGSYSLGQHSTRRLYCILASASASASVQQQQQRAKINALFDIIIFKIAARVLHKEMVRAYLIVKM